MRVLSRRTLVDFWFRNPAAEASLRHWFEVAEAATWQSPFEVVQSFSKAKALGGDRVRFEIAGGDFRLIVAFDFGRAIAFVKFVGSHADYDRVDALTVAEF